MAAFMVETFKISAQKIIVVPLGANEQMYQPRKETKKKSNSAVQVFFFGLFNPLHGLPSIMEAIKLLKKESGIEFTILGDGYLKEELHDFAKKHDLKNLKFHGFVQEKELVTFIQDCDIMLGIFSKNPTMVKVVPNKVFAGLACKRAVITAKLPSTESTFEHGKDIYLCEPEDPKSLADAIKKLVKDKTLRDNIAAAGYKSYQDKFTSTSIIKPLIKEAEARI
jgi:glycosyltransferase involved in cell wall biosynthesis